MTVKSQTFEDRIAQAVEFPFFPFAFPTNYYAVGRVPYKFSFAQQPAHKSVAGLELGYLFRAHAAFRPTCPIYPLSGEVAVPAAWANLGAWGVCLSRCSLLLAGVRRILLPAALREQLNRLCSCGLLWLYVARYFRAVTLTLDLMSRIAMTSQDLQELKRVQLEWYAARDAFEKAIQDSESLAEINEALNTLRQKTAACHAFGWVTRAGL
jgi:hypothetical protein